MKPLITVLVMMLACNPLYAQNDQSEPNRKGFVIGLSAGAG